MLVAKGAVNMAQNEMVEALAQHSKAERKRQSKRALLILFVLCPSVAIGTILLLKVLMSFGPPV